MSYTTSSTTYAKPEVFSSNYDTGNYGGLPEDSRKSNQVSKNQQGTNNQAAASAAATEQSAAAASKRTQQDGVALAGLRDQINNNDDQVVARQEQRKYSNDRQDTQIKNKFTSDEAGKDRSKSSDEFTENRYQQRANQAQDRSNLEFSTNAANADRDRQRQADSSIKDRDIVANQNLAQLNSTTTLAGQQAQLQGSLAQSSSQLQGSLAQSKAQVDSTKLSADSQLSAAQAAAKAQVTAALYGSRPSYQGY